MAVKMEEEKSKQPALKCWIMILADKAEMATKVRPRYLCGVRERTACYGKCLPSKSLATGIIEAASRNPAHNIVFATDVSATLFLLQVPVNFVVLVANAWHFHLKREVSAVAIVEKAVTQPAPVPTKLLQ